VYDAIDPQPTKAELKFRTAAALVLSFCPRVQEELAMRRREFMSLLGGAAAWPLAVHAQQTERMRRIGVLMHTAADEPESQARLAAFMQGLQDGPSVANLQIDYRWSVGDSLAT
jgi:hypothetical protein